AQGAARQRARGKGRDARRGGRFCRLVRGKWPGWRHWRQWHWRSAANSFCSNSGSGAEERHPKALSERLEAKARTPESEGLAAAAAAAWRCNAAGMRGAAVDMDVTAATRGHDGDSVPMWLPVSMWLVSCAASHPLRHFVPPPPKH
ncbi:MAG: hypothetical protein J0L63_19615, partial [Anaerolineae bacterium]|nr:hypothetical protein [Anaerolineae bacterium]